MPLSPPQVSPTSPSPLAPIYPCPHSSALPHQPASLQAVPEISKSSSCTCPACPCVSHTTPRSQHEQLSRSGLLLGRALKDKAAGHLACSQCQPRTAPRRSGERGGPQLRSSLTAGFLFRQALNPKRPEGCSQKPWGRWWLGRQSRTDEQQDA